MPAVLPNTASLELPIAYFLGPDANTLAARYNGASRLANFALQTMTDNRPDLRVQGINGLRLGKFHLAMQFSGNRIGSLMLELHSEQHGGRILGTTHREHSGAQEIWEADWLRGQEPGEFYPGTALHQTPRATEIYNYTGKIMEVRAPVVGTDLAAVSGIGFRAVEAFGVYHDQLASGMQNPLPNPEDLVYMSMMQFSSTPPPNRPERAIAPGGLPGRG